MYGNGNEDDQNDEKELVIQGIKSFKEAYLNCSKKTQLLINFFQNEFGFRKEEVLFIGEQEAKYLEVLINQIQFSKVYFKETQNAEPT